MKTTTIVAVTLGLLIAMLPAVVAFQPVNKLPAYGKANPTNVITGGKYQYWNTRAEIEYRNGVKYDQDSLRIRIARGPGSYRRDLQTRYGRELQPTNFQVVQKMGGQPGAPSVKTVTAE